MEYPVFFGDTVIGNLCVSREGLYTRFDAACEMQEGVLRLWLKGEDKTSYIGVLLPQNGRLVLKKTFSRIAAAALPKNIICAVVAEKAPACEYTPAQKTKEDSGWHAGRGCLCKKEGNITLIAIPTELQALNGTRIETIKSKRYMIFRY